MSLEVIHGGYAWPGREPVLTGVNFRFDGTGVMSILGPNGAGKTTLLRRMLGRDPAVCPRCGKTLLPMVRVMGPMRC